MQITGLCRALILSCGTRKTCSCHQSTSLWASSLKATEIHCVHNSILIVYTVTLQCVCCYILLYILYFPQISCSELCDVRVSIDFDHSTHLWSRCPVHNCCCPMTLSCRRHFKQTQRVLPASQILIIADTVQTTRTASFKRRRFSSCRVVLGGCPPPCDTR